MPSIYQRQPTSNSLHLITQTIPSRRTTSGTTNHHQQQQQIDVRQNPGFSLRYDFFFSVINNKLHFSRTHPLSAGTKKTTGITPFTQSTNGVRDSLVRRKYRCHAFFPFKNLRLI
jgi:hypothetical protein